MAGVDDGKLNSKRKQSEHVALILYGDGDRGQKKAHP
jgi:hypothetical protein